MGLPSREEIDAVLKVQKKEDNSVTAKIQGKQTNPSSAHTGEPHASPRWPVHGGEGSADRVGPGGQMRLEFGRYTTHVDVALGLIRHWTLNKLQSMADFLEEHGMRLQEEGGRQHFQYVGGEGGTGKSRAIHAIKNMFRVKDGLHALLLTGASGNAAALIGGVTLHSAANIAFEGRAAAAKNVLEEEKLRWKNIIMLIIDEISQVGGLTLAAVDSRQAAQRRPASTVWRDPNGPVLRRLLSVRPRPTTNVDWSTHSGFSPAPPPQPGLINILTGTGPAGRRRPTVSPDFNPTRNPGASTVLATSAN